MAKRISELPAAGAVADADELELNQSGTSRKATRAQIVAGLAAATHGHTLADVTDAGALAAKDVVAEADIANAAVTTAKLADLSVGSAKLALGAVATDQLADAAVTDPKIADGAVTTAKIAPGAVDSGQLADAAVTNFKIADGAVTTAKIAANAVDSGQLADDAVVTAKIAAGAVTAAEIAASAVGPTQLANDAVTMAKIAAGAVTAAKIAANAVTATQLASNAVTASKIDAGAVTTGKIAAGAVGPDQLADDAVTTPKIAAGAVTAAEIAAGVVGPTQLANTAVIPGVYTVATVTVDQQGRITAASNGVAGEVNTGANAGTDGVGVFAGKVGVDLQFRHVAPGSNKVTVTLNGEDIDIDVVEGNLQIPIANVVGLQLALNGKSDAGHGHAIADTTGLQAALDGKAPVSHLHSLSDVVNAGALASKSVVGEADLSDGAVTPAKLDRAYATTAQGAKADTALQPAQIATGAITPKQGALDLNNLGGGAAWAARQALPTAGTLPIDLSGDGVYPAVVATGAVAFALAPSPTIGAEALITLIPHADGVTFGAEFVPAGWQSGHFGFHIFGAGVPYTLRMQYDAGTGRVLVSTLPIQTPEIANGAVSRDKLGDDVEGNLQIPAGNVTGLAAVATVGTLAALTSLDAGGAMPTNYRAAQDTASGAYTFVQSDSGREKIFTGAAPANWTIPALGAGAHAVVHNLGTAAITFVASGVTLKGLTTLAADKSAAVSWLPGSVVKLTGELS